MSLESWAKNGWLRPHKTSKEEIRNLLQIVDRDLQDSQSKELSDDWKFGIAYSAALKLCTIPYLKHRERTPAVIPLAF